MPPVSVLIKPASGKCNLRCEYCFYHDEAENRETPDFGLMSVSTLEVIVRRVFEICEGSASFSFQGGEPTVRGLDFYREYVRLLETYNKNALPVQSCLQTNGVLIDEAWAGFLGKHRFLVGLSLDGPKKLHDRFRRHGSGGGTYAEVMRCARLLEQHGVEYNILFTVTSQSAEEPGKLYSFFKENRFRYLQFMPCIDPMEGRRGRERYSLKPLEFGNFLKKFFDRWAKDVLADDGISVRYFDNLISMAAGYPPEACSLRGHCSCQFVFEADGSCYPCDFYVNEAFCMGKIQDMSLEALFSSEAAQRFLRAGAAMGAECAACKWNRICRGGCRRDRDAQLHTNYFCKSYKVFFEYAYPMLLAVSAHVAKRRPGR